MKRNKKCERCRLHRDVFHNRCVWGYGNENADLMLVGEAPGFQEDFEGIPFCGEAGGGGGGGMKPCPFCGGNAKKHFGVDCKWDTEIECRDCGARMPWFDSKEGYADCQTRWNKRLHNGKDKYSDE